MLAGLSSLLCFSIFISAEMFFKVARFSKEMTFTRPLCSLIRSRKSYARFCFCSRRNLATLEKVSFFGSKILKCDRIVSSAVEELWKLEGCGLPRGDIEPERWELR